MSTNGRCLARDGRGGDEGEDVPAATVTAAGQALLLLVRSLWATVAHGAAHGAAAHGVANENPAVVVPHDAVHSAFPLWLLAADSHTSSPGLDWRGSEREHGHVHEQPQSAAAAPNGAATGLLYCRSDVLHCSFFQGPERRLATAEPVVYGLVSDPQQLHLAACSTRGPAGGCDRVRSSSCVRRPSL